MPEDVQTELAILREFATLKPARIEAEWSVTRIGTGTVPGPSATISWAVMRYSQNDLASVSHRSKRTRRCRPQPLALRPLGW